MVDIHSLLVPMECFRLEKTETNVLSIDYIFDVDVCE